MLEHSSIKQEPFKNSQKLYIIFGGKNTGIGMPPFEFCRASNILNENKVFVRDISQAWYHCGLSGITKDIDSTAIYLKKVIHSYQPKETILIGNSMGGFAAILFASLIKNCRAIAFAPQTFLGPVSRLKNNEWRWKSETFSTYIKTISKKKYFNLRSLKDDNADWRADIIVSEDHSRDLAHALNITELSQVKLHRYNSNKHRIVKVLRERNLLGEILRGDFSSSESNEPCL